VVLTGQAAPRAPLKVVEAERFILMGRSGKPRAILTEASDGNVGLRFVDGSGQVRMALSVEGNGQPNLALSDSKGGRRIGMTVSTDGSVTLGILDAAEKDRAALGLSSDGTMGFFLSDRDNTRRMILALGRRVPRVSDCTTRPMVPASSPWRRKVRHHTLLSSTKRARYSGRRHEGRASSSQAPVASHRTPHASDRRRSIR